MKLDFFKKIAYPLDYLSIRVAGVEISNHSVRFLEFFNEHGRLSVKNFGEIVFPENTMKDGDILNKDAFTKVFSELKNKISVESLNVSVPEQKTYIFEIRLPKMNKGEIRQALEFHLEENVPFKAGEVLFEYEIIGEDKQDGGIFASVSVIPKTTIESYSDAIVASGFFPVNFEIESRMTARSVIPKDDKKSYVILNVKYSSTIFSFVDGNTVRFTSVLNIGKSYIDESLEKAGVSPSNQNKNSMASSLNIYSIIKDELEKFIDYVKSKSIGGDDAIRKIIACGDSADLPGFLNHVGQNIDMEIVPANVWSNTFDINNYLPPIDFKESLNFATAVGLAMPYMKLKNINKNA